MQMDQNATELNGTETMEPAVQPRRRRRSERHEHPQGEEHTAQQREQEAPAVNGVGFVPVFQPAQGTQPAAGSNGGRVTASVPTFRPAQTARQAVSSDAGAAVQPVQSGRQPVTPQGNAAGKVPGFTASQPVTQKPIQTQPVGSNPIQTQPVRSNPVRTQPVTPNLGKDTRGVPVFQPNPTGGQPVTPNPAQQPVRSNPIQTQPVWSNPVRTQPVTPNPGMPIGGVPVFQPIQTGRQPVTPNPVQQPVTQNPTQTQPVRSNPVWTQPMTPNPGKDAGSTPVFAPNPMGGQSGAGFTPVQKGPGSAGKAILNAAGGAGNLWARFKAWPAFRKLSLAHLILSVYYVIFLVSGVVDVAQNATILVGFAYGLVHRLAALMFIAGVFSIVGFFLKRPWPYLTSAIIGSIAPVFSWVIMSLASELMLMHLPLVIIGYVTYAKAKKAARSPIPPNSGS